MKEDGFRKGVTLYRVVWKDYSAAATTWEPAENIHDEIIADYEAALEAEAQLDAEEAAELAAEEAAEAGRDAALHAALRRVQQLTADNEQLARARAQAEERASQLSAEQLLLQGRLTALASDKARAEEAASRCLAEALQAKFDHEAEGTTADGTGHQDGGGAGAWGGSWWQPAVH